MFLTQAQPTHSCSAVLLPGAIGQCVMGDELRAELREQISYEFFKEWFGMASGVCPDRPVSIGDFSELSPAGRISQEYSLACVCIRERRWRYA